MGMVERKIALITDGNGEIKGRRLLQCDAMKLRIAIVADRRAYLL